MSKYEYGQINVRLDLPKFKKLRELCRADNRSLASYTRIIIEDYLDSRYITQKLKRGRNADQTE